MKLDRSPTEDASQSKRRHRKSAPLSKQEFQTPIDWRNWPAFNYYRCLRRVKRQLGDDSTQPLTLPAVARIACLEPKYFSTFFYQKVGISFVAWRNSLRVNKALELIRKGDYPLGRVADAAGFNDVRTFERAFKKHTGMTAAEFRKLIASSRAGHVSVFTNFAG